MFGSHRTRSTSRRHKRHQKSPPARRGPIFSARFEQLEARAMLSSNPTLSIPTTLVGSRNGVVAVPIDVNQLTDNLAGSLISTFSFGPNSPVDFSQLAYINCTRAGLSSADFAVDFDPNVFTVSRSDVHLGTIPSNSVALFPFSLQPNSNPPAIGWTLTVSMSPSASGPVEYSHCRQLQICQYHQRQGDIIAHEHLRHAFCWFRCKQHTHGSGRRLDRFAGDDRFPY